MSIGSSGRIVIEVEPGVKRELHAALAREGSTLKEWFLRSAQSYLSTTSEKRSSPLASPTSEVAANQRATTTDAMDTQASLAEIPKS